MQYPETDLIPILPPGSAQWRTLDGCLPTKDNGLHPHPSVLEGTILGVVGLDIKLEQGDEGLGGLIQVHAALGTVNGYVGGPGGSTRETEAGQTSEMSPTLARDEHVLEAGEGATEAQLTCQPLGALSAVKQVSGHKTLDIYRDKVSWTVHLLWSV